MKLPDPQVSRAALLVGSAFGIGYIIRQGMDHSSEMDARDKRRIGIGLLVVAIGSVGAQYVPPIWEKLQ